MSTDLYKIILTEEWKQWSEDPPHMIPLSPLDQKDGFVHLSTQAALLQTCRLYFQHRDPIALVFAQEDLETDLQWEWVESRQANFPHLYRNLRWSEIKGFHQIIWHNGIVENEPLLGIFQQIP